MEIFLLLLIFVTTLFFVFIKTPKGKGIVGETLIKINLGKSIEGKKYVFNNCMFLDGEKTIQVDHILISEIGVIVIETKNYAGRIYGEENQQEWTQVLQYGKIKNKFYNPIKQNNSHCYYIKKILPTNIPVIPLIVFIKNNTDYINSDKVIGLKDLRKTIKMLPNIIDIDLICNAAKVIEENLNCDIKNSQHVKNIHQLKENINNNICPRCGGNLELKKGKYGEFYGCSNYPKCKFIKK